MNILLLSSYFYPEIGAAASLFYDLARGLTRQGDKVTVVTNFPWYNLETIPEIYKRKFYMRENIDGIEVIRMRFPVFGHKKLKLAMSHFTIPFLSFFGGCLAKRPDIIFVYSPPLFMGITAWFLKLFLCFYETFGDTCGRRSCKGKRVPFVLNVQDLHPQCYIDQGILKNKFLIYLMKMIERFCYKKSSLITVHSQGNKEYIMSVKGIDENKVKVLPNWINTDEIKPLTKDNEFSKKHNINKKFIVGYAGTIGISQGALNIIDATYILKDRDDIEFFIVGDGIEKQKMLDKVSAMQLKNVRFLGMQPNEVYPYVLASFDIVLVTLNSKVLTPVVPSKIMSIMSAARTVLASIPLSGDVPKLIEDAECGICIGPENPEELAEKIKYLAENRDICRKFGENGRKYVTENFSLQKTIKDLENMFNALII